jgi:acetyltransferase
VLSEFESMRLLAPLGVPFPRERTALSASEAVLAARELGFPVVVKVSGRGLAHKSERGLVELSLADEDAVERAVNRLASRLSPEDGETAFLVSEMISGHRELIVGARRDASFGSVVVVGWGGVLAEAMGRTASTPLPVTQTDINDLCRRSGVDALLGEVRGERTVDRRALFSVVHALGEAMAQHPDVVSIDLNPLKITPDGRLIAVDCLVELGVAAADPPIRTFHAGSRHFEALFDPSSVVVVGASSHPGKFGFVTLHNLIAAGFQGLVSATNPASPEILGIQTVASVPDLPGRVDLAVLCTPASANEAIVRDCAARGAKAIFVASAGYRESGDHAAEARLAELCSSLDVMLVGPNGQGVVSTTSGLCAQIVAPYPPAGRVSIVSQSGNLVSSFENMAVSSGVGISRAVSVGNSAQVGVSEFVRFYAGDAATDVVVAYVEDPGDGVELRNAFDAAAAQKPIVVVKGGTTAAGTRAAASHTGALASDSSVFEGAVRASGAIAAVDPEHAFDLAAAFATQPLPRGRRVVILTTVGGWGVLSADEVARNGDLDLIELPGDLVASIDRLLPARWSGSNPIDCAGGETRDTVPALIDEVAGHSGVDAVVLLGLGIQSNQAALMANGPFAVDPDVARIVDFHRRQDTRYVECAHAASQRHNKPFMVATELALTDPTNPGPATARRLGTHCFPSGPRALRALGGMVRYAERRSQR